MNDKKYGTKLVSVAHTQSTAKQDSATFIILLDTQINHIQGVKKTIILSQLKAYSSSAYIRRQINTQIKLQKL